MCISHLNMCTGAWQLCHAPVHMFRPGITVLCNDYDRAFRTISARTVVSSVALN
jgi:hypothetical protein